MLVTILLVALCLPLAGQSGVEDSQADEHHFHHNDIGVFLGGMTPLSKTEQTSFAIGVDYERRITQSIGVGVLVDFVFGDHKRSALVAAMFVGRPVPSLRLAIGPGFEVVEEAVTSNGGTTTKNTAYFVIATGAMYDFHFGNFLLSPTVGVDFVGETKTNLLYGLTFGYGF